MPGSLTALLQATVTPPAGKATSVIGTVVGFVLALVVLAVGVVSFPLRPDRDVSLPVAVKSPVRVTADNPVVIATWGGIVAEMLPVRRGCRWGDATWHLYPAAAV